jgi:hypothetical protein
LYRCISSTITSCFDHCNYLHVNLYNTRLERCTLWSTMEFLRRSRSHIT